MNEQTKARLEATIAPTFDDFEKLDKWAWDTFNSAKVAEHVASMTTRKFNEMWAGKSALEIETYYL